MVDLGHLVAERAIHLQLCAIARSMDERDWGGLDGVIAEDATGDFGDGCEVSGRAGFVEIFQRYLGACGSTQHLLGNLEVSIQGNVAESRCYVRDMHQGMGDAEHLFCSSPGIYLDRWRRTPDGWRLTHRTKKNLMMIGSIAALGAASPDASRPGET